MKKFVYNSNRLRERRRDLRHEQTKFERLLWDHISRKQLGGLRFCQQYSVGGYVLDFYCPKIRLAIELDGKLHNETDTKIYDQERTEFLESLDIKVIRFKNIEVVKDMKEILAKILSYAPLE